MTHSYRAALTNGNCKCCFPDQFSGLHLGIYHGTVDECVVDFTKYIIFTAFMLHYDVTSTKKPEDVYDDFSIATIKNVSIWRWNNLTPHVSAPAECKNPKS